MKFFKNIYFKVFNQDILVKIENQIHKQAQTKTNKL